MSSKAIAALVIGVLIAIGLCVVGATADSCKRLNRPCFGNTSTK